jgi:hypothetical protein
MNFSFACTTPHLLLLLGGGSPMTDQNKDEEKAIKEFATRNFFVSDEKGKKILETKENLWWVVG